MLLCVYCTHYSIHTKVMMLGPNQLACWYRIMDVPVSSALRRLGITSNDQLMHTHITSHQSKHERNKIRWNGLCRVYYYLLLLLSFANSITGMIHRHIYTVHVINVVKYQKQIRIMNPPPWLNDVFVPDFDCKATSPLDTKRDLQQL